ncbi:MAG: RnfABCDGE type electron transport complex subunit G [Gammaproteobacteria bacterium]|nr:RnfABCDGE type electron transport complex subunit G [Gammaproteobacteria bacterium]
MSIHTKILKPTLLALTCALLLAFTSQQTQETIESNQRHYEERVLREMVNGAELQQSSSGYDVFREGTQIGTIEPFTTARGYNGRIDLLIALNSDRKVISVRVTHHEETPGIGDKIELDVSGWIHQFAGRSADDTDWTLSPGGDIDAISGATITSRAITDAIAEVLSE